MHEQAFKKHYGEPPIPEQKYRACKDGERLKEALVVAAGQSSWEAGYIEAVFAIGENFKLLLVPRFGHIWHSVGVPPGPWADSYGKRSA